MKKQNKNISVGGAGGDGGFPTAIVGINGIPITPEYEQLKRIADSLEKLVKQNENKSK